MSSYSTEHAQTSVCGRHAFNVLHQLFDQGGALCPLFLYLVSPLFVKPEFMHLCMLLYGECSFWTAFGVINMLSVRDASWPSVEIPLMSHWKWWFAVAEYFTFIMHTSSWQRHLKDYEAARLGNLITMKCIAQPCMCGIIIAFKDVILCNLFYVTLLVPCDLMWIQEYRFNINPITHRNNTPNMY